MAKAFPLKPLLGWAVLRQLTPEEVAAIERPAAQAKTSSLIIIEAPRASGEEMKPHRWCEVLRVDDETTSIKPGDRVFAWVISGSQGPNDDWHTLDGVKFFQMPVKDIMGVLE